MLKIPQKFEIFDKKISSSVGAALADLKVKKLGTGRKTINAATSPKVDEGERSERRPEAFCTVSSTLFVSDSRLVRLTKSEYPPVSRY